MFNPLNIIGKFFKSNNEKELNRLNFLAIQINAHENEIKKLSDDQFPIKTIELKQ